MPNDYLLAILEANTLHHLSGMPEFEDPESSFQRREVSCRYGHESHVIFGCRYFVDTDMGSGRAAVWRGGRQRRSTDGGGNGDSIAIMYGVFPAAIHLRNASVDRNGDGNGLAQINRYLCLVAAAVRESKDNLARAVLVSIDAQHSRPLITGNCGAAKTGIGRRDIGNHTIGTACDADYTAGGCDIVRIGLDGGARHGLDRQRRWRGCCAAA